MQVGVASLKTEGSDLEEGEFECGLKVAGIVLLRGPLSNIVKVCVKELGVLGCKVTPFVGITPPSLLTPPTGTARVTLCAVHVSGAHVIDALARGRSSGWVGVAGDGINAISESPPAPLETLWGMLERGQCALVPNLRVASWQCMPTARLDHGGGLPRRPQNSAAATAKPSPPRFTFVELFAGIGGFRVGLEPLGGACVFASELDHEARSTYLDNFSSGVTDEQVLWGDIKELDLEPVPPSALLNTSEEGESRETGLLNSTGYRGYKPPPRGFDILTAGFPCQSFTIAGARRGLHEERGQLFFEVARFLQVCQPRSFLLENVANLLWVEGGSRRDRVGGMALVTILHALKAVGYTVVYRVIHSQAWVPQKRERLYFVGFRNDLAPAAMRAFRWPDKAGVDEARSIPVRCAVSHELSVDGVAGRSTGGNGGEGNARGEGSQEDDDEEDEEEEEGVVDGEESRSEIEARRWSCGRCVSDLLEPEEAATTRACELTEAQWDQVRLKSTTYLNQGDVRRMVNLRGVARTLMSSYRSGFRYHAEFVPPPALLTGSADGIKAASSGKGGADGDAGGSVRSRPRFFTPREAARLMGFPDSFKLGEAKNANRLYHQIGNAVCPPVIESLGASILEALDAVD